jgi:hypothetical protein
MQGVMSPAFQYFKRVRGRIWPLSLALETASHGLTLMLVAAAAAVLRWKRLPFDSAYLKVAAVAHDLGANLEQRQICRTRSGLCLASRNFNRCAICAGRGDADVTELAGKHWDRCAPNF